MTIDELKALPIGTIVALPHADGELEYGRIDANTELQAIIKWPACGTSVHVGYTPSWESFIRELRLGIPVQQPAKEEGCGGRSGCKNPPSAESHTCPYAEDVNDDHETECFCCEDCQSECADDI